LVQGDHVCWQTNAEKREKERAEREAKLLAQKQERDAAAAAAAQARKIDAENKRQLMRRSGKGQFQIGAALASIGDQQQAAVPAADSAAPSAGTPVEGKRTGSLQAGGLQTPAALTVGLSPRPLSPSPLTISATPRHGSGSLARAAPQPVAAKPLPPPEPEIALNREQILRKRKKDAVRWGIETTLKMEKLIVHGHHYAKHLEQFFERCHRLLQEVRLQSEQAQRNHVRHSYLFQHFCR
jgi:hypothetical protein